MEKRKQPDLFEGTLAYIFWYCGDNSTWQTLPDGQAGCCAPVLLSGKLRGIPVGVPNDHCYGACRISSYDILYALGTDNAKHEIFIFGITHNAL